jgi:hypothetical protein
LVKESESVNDRKPIAARHQDERLLNDRLFHDFVDQYLDNLSRPMREQENKSYDDIEELYILYTAQRVIEQVNLRNAYELIQELEKLQLESTAMMIAQLETMDSVVQTCDNMLNMIAKDWRKAVTRLHRLTAIDVNDSEKRKHEIAKRFQHYEAFPLVLQLRLDIAQTTTNIGGINAGLNQIRRGLKEVDDKVLDVYVATEISMYAAALEEEKGR